MEKKKCPQCKNFILKTSPTCLYCGRPNKFITKEYINKKWNKDNNKNVIDGITYTSIAKLTTKNQRKNELIELIGGGSCEVNEYASRLLDRSAA